MRQNISGGSPFEPIIGFSRAVRSGCNIYVSGTGPVGADAADAAAQTSRVFEIIVSVLKQAGASLENVVRTRIYLTHAEDWEEVARVHAKAFWRDSTRRDHGCGGQIIESHLAGGDRS